MENVTKQAQNFRDKAKDEASSMAERAKETAASMGDKAKQVAGSVAEQVSDTARSLADKPRQATTAVGGGLKNVAETIREHSPQSGVLHSASSSIADSLESGGQYLQERGLGGMGEDLTDVIRRNPIPAVLIGIGIGFLIARATRS